MSVRAKVRCEGIKGNEVSFYTVYEPDATKDTENARFTKATPWGRISLGIDNPTALQQFEAGKEYYVDFNLAEQAVRAWPNVRALKFKQPDLNTGMVYEQDCDGWYLVPHRGVTLKVIASDGLGWDHVSVSTRHRCPTWDEMEYIRELFFRDDETVMQLSVPRNEHINHHPNCLHWWRPQGREIPRPEAVLV